MNGDGWFDFEYLAFATGGFLLGCLVAGMVSGWARRNFESLTAVIEKRFASKFDGLEDSLQERFTRLNALIHRSRCAEKKANRYAVKLLQLKLSSHEAHISLQVCKDSVFDVMKTIRDSVSSPSHNKSTSDATAIHDIQEAEKKLHAIEENLMHLAGRMENADRLLTRFHEPFDWLNSLNPERLGALLYDDESPEVLALVLPHLETAEAAAFLNTLPAEQWGSIAEKMFNSGEDSIVLRQIECELGEKYLRQLSPEGLQDYAQASFFEIARCAQPLVRREMISGAANGDMDLQAEIERALICFEDLLRLDDRVVQQVLKEVDFKQLALALRGAENDVKAKVFENLSQRGADSLREDMEFMGSVAVHDVYNAQLQIAEIIRRLCNNGQIMMNEMHEEA